MLEAIMEILRIMGWVGVVLGIIATVNLICGTNLLISTWSNIFLKKFFKGILKCNFLYEAVFVSVAFTMLPYINTMITDALDRLLSKAIIKHFIKCRSLGIVVASVVTS